MTDYDDQPIVTIEDVYSLAWVWIGRIAGFAFLCALVGYVWGKL